MPSQPPPPDRRVTELTLALLHQRSDVTNVGASALWGRRRRGRGRRWMEFTGGPHYFDDDCIYDPVDDATAKRLLEALVARNPEIGWSVGQELSKLLAKRGRVAHDAVMPVVRSLAGAVNAKGELTVSFASLHQLCLSYLAVLPEGERLALAMLDFVPEDCRDGLLLACYRLNTAAIYDKVKACVRRWAGDDWCGGSTGEAHLIARMVQRWDETFPGGDHEDVRGIVSGAER